MPLEVMLARPRHHPVSLWFSFARKWTNSLILRSHCPNAQVNSTKISNNTRKHQKWQQNKSCPSLIVTVRYLVTMTRKMANARINLSSKPHYPPLAGSQSPRGNTPLRHIPVPIVQRGLLDTAACQKHSDEPDGNLLHSSPALPTASYPATKPLCILSPVPLTGQGFLVGPVWQPMTLLVET